MTKAVIELGQEEAMFMYRVFSEELIRVRHEYRDTLMRQKETGNDYSSWLKEIDNQIDTLERCQGICLDTMGD